LTDEKFREWLLETLCDFSKKIHDSMDDNDNNRYRCLSYMYTKVLQVINHIELSYPIIDKDDMGKRDIKHLEQNHPFKNVLFKHQEEIINCKKSTIICNWCRNASKTFTLAKTIEYNEPLNVMYISFLEDFADSMFLNEIKQYTNLKIKELEPNYMVLEGINSKQIYICSDRYKNLNKNILFDYLMFDEFLPFNVGVKAKQIMSMITYNNYNQWLQRFFPGASILQIDYKEIVKLGLLKNEFILETRKLNPQKYYNEFAILDKPII
jgi:hypothetical protein